MKTKVTAPSAWIVSSTDRGRKSIKKGKVYLKDTEVFEIELYNPLQVCVLADISLNGNLISTGGLILNPGQRFYLDCFIDDKKKFVFNTYEVDDSEETKSAISKNGLLEVKFYKEKVIIKNPFNNLGTTRTIYGGPNYGGYYGGSTFTTNTIGGGYVNLTSSGVPTNASFYSSNIVNCSGTLSDSSLDINFNNQSISKSIETGRVEKGSKSNQEFVSVDMDFESYPVSTTTLHILPDSNRPIETKELIKNNSKSVDIVELIKKISDLHDLGILTDDEFTKKKSELLSKI